MINYLNKPENGLISYQKTGNITTSVTYRPTQIIQGRYSANDKSSIKDGFSDLEKKYFFVLSLSIDGKELLKQLPSDQYSEMVQVIAFRMSSYVTAVCKNCNTSVSPESCLFQQTYGVGLSNQILLVFKRWPFKEAEQLDIIVKEFGLNIGNLDFPFRIKDINAVQDVTLTD